MTILQLIVFAWVSSWVLCESIFPGIDYKSRILACIISAFTAAYTNNAHGVLWKKIMRRK